MNAPVINRDRKPAAKSAGIDVRDVTVTYRNGHTALRDASFSIPTGTIAALVGVNGSGCESFGEVGSKRGEGGRGKDDDGGG